MSKAIATPLHLLQTLTHTLNEELQGACARAEQEALKALEKPDRQQAKLRDKLEESEQRLAQKRQEQASKKSIARTTDKLADLRLALKELQGARKDAQAYVRQLRSDTRETLRLAKGLQRLEQQVDEAIERRDNPAAAPRRRRTPAKAASDSSAQPA